MNLFKSFKSTISNFKDKFTKRKPFKIVEAEKKSVESSLNPLSAHKGILPNQEPFEGWKEIFRNDKEHIVIKQHTKTKEVRKYWYGVLMDIKNFGQFSKLKGIS